MELQLAALRFLLAPPTSLSHQLLECRWAETFLTRVCHSPIFPPCHSMPIPQLPTPLTIFPSTKPKFMALALPVPPVPVQFTMVVQATITPSPRVVLPTRPLPRPRLCTTMFQYPSPTLNLNRWPLPLRLVLRLPQEPVPRVQVRTPARRL